MKPPKSPSSSPNASERSDDDADSISEDDSAEEQEDPKDYKIGGYCPIKIDSILNDRYYVIRKAGWGHFSTVWLCWDMKNKRFTAVKVAKSARVYRETALDEIKLLNSIIVGDVTDTRRSKLVQMYDSFFVESENGEHVCMAFEVLGSNILHTLQRNNYKGMPLENVKTITRQMLEALAYLHDKCNIIHTDVKPENIMYCMTWQTVKDTAKNALQITRAGYPLAKNAVGSNEHSTPSWASSISEGERKLKRNPSISIESRLQTAEDISDKTSNELKLISTREPRSLVSAKSVSGERRMESMSINPVLDGMNKSFSEQSSSKDGKQPTTLDEILAVTKSLINQEKITDISRSSKKEGQMDEDSRHGRTGYGISDIRPSPLDSPKSGSLTGDRSPSEEDEVGGEMKDEMNLLKTLQMMSKSPEQSQDEDSLTTFDFSPTSSPKKTNDRSSPTSTPVAVMPKLFSFGKFASNSRSKLSKMIEEEINEADRQKGGPFKEVKTPNVGKVVCDVQVKLADLGNACWRDRHFTDDIQTRQYQAIEVILGDSYDCAADIWSVACTAFEMATGDYLFDPKSKEDTKENDHLALIVQMLGPIPQNIVNRGKKSFKFYDATGKLRHEKLVKSVSLKEILIKKYHWNEKDAEDFSNFLLPMLNLDQKKRATAEQCLSHPWLK